MPKIVKPLTYTTIEKAKPSFREYKLADGKGLYLLVKPNGKKKWLFNYRRLNSLSNGGRTNIYLGDFPNCSLTQARNLREKYNTLLAQHIDPQIARKIRLQKDQLQREYTFQVIMKKWLSKKSLEVEPTTVEKFCQFLRNHLLPKLANIPIAEITPMLVIDILTPLSLRKKGETLRRVIRLLNEILNFAVNTGVLSFNPCIKIKDAFPKYSSNNNPTIRPETISELFNQLEKNQIPAQAKALLLWQLLTMVRPNEAVTACWSDIDFSAGIWSIPAEKMKKTKSRKNQPHIVFLSSQAQQILHFLQKQTKNTDYLFPSERKIGQHINRQFLNNLLKKLGYQNRLTAHGLRSIASTFLHEADFQPDVIERCLSHEIGGIRGVYNRSDYLIQRRQALQKWGDFIEKNQGLTWLK